MTEVSAGQFLAAVDLESPVATCPRLPDREHAPEQVCRDVAQAATCIREGEWLLFGWKQVRVSSPPLWHRDYLHGRDAPFGVAARRLEYRHLAGDADARCIWETNRWAEMVRLAQNAWLNEALDDARLAQHWLCDWCDHNPLGVGINWCSALEAGLRLVTSLDGRARPRLRQ